MNQIRQQDIEPTILDFQRSNRPTARYASFDYCYRYFLRSSSDVLLSDMEKSCLVLGFYLASWGMFRGSSFLLSKSAKHFEPLIEFIAKQDKAIWTIDVDKYDERNVEIVLDVYAQIRGIVIQNGNAHLVLVTKIMLGVFGFIPAFDTYFGNTFRAMFGDCGFRSVNKKSLSRIKQFYDYNSVEIDHLADQIFVTDFVSGEKTTINYPKAKIIDMYGFTKGLKRS